MGAWGFARGRDFQRLFATRLVSQFGDGVVQITLGGFLFFSPEKQTSAGRAAAAFALLLLPYSLVAPFAGVFIDRWRRRQILVYAPLVRAVLVLVMAWLIVAAGDAFFVAALFVLGINRFFLAALPASLPHVVAERDLLLANTITPTAGTVAAFAGAGVGFGVARAGTTTTLVFCAALYVLTALVARTIDADRLGPSDVRRETVGNVLRGLADGTRHVLRRRHAALALGAISLHRFLYGLWLLMTLLLYRNVFPSGFEGIALITGVSGGGYFLGAVITPWAVRRVGKDGWIAILLALAGFSLLAFATPFRQTPYVVGGFLLGVASQGIKVCVDTIVQENVDDEFRGRVFSAYDMLFNITFVAAGGVATLALPPTGDSYPVLGCTIMAYAVAAVAYLLLTRSLRPEHTGRARPDSAA
ncbi:MAG: MFS transporter [Streptosporangiaceae bacterium]